MRRRTDVMREIVLWTRRFFVALLTLLALSYRAGAEREPVLKQIDVPHPYYYR